MIPDPDSNSKNAPAVINNLRNKLMWATQIHYSVLPKQHKVMIVFTFVIGNNNKDG